MRRINNFKHDKISYLKLMESYQGWQAYVKWSNSLNLRKVILKTIYKIRKELDRNVKSHKNKTFI